SSQDQRAMLLERRGGVSSDHPASVATTWSLSFQKVEQQCPAAADLLRLYAFLHPDAIPEEMIARDTLSLAFLRGKRKSGGLFSTVISSFRGKRGSPAKAQDRFVLDDAIRALSAYSLVRRNVSDKTISMHRLVQAVLRDTMDEKMRQQWAKRTVQIVNDA